MPTLPRANVTVEATASALAKGTKLVCVLAPVPDSADIVPRQFGSATALYEQHGYSDGVEYAAHHTEQTGLPVLFVGLPIATAGVVSRVSSGGNSGTCAVSVAAGSDGVLTEHDGVLKVSAGGTIGTDQIVLSISLDGGFTFQKARLGTASSYVIPYVGVTVSFAAGTLVAGDTIHTWHGSSPRSNAAGWAAARAALGSQQKAFRTILLCGDVADSTEAAAFLAMVEAYKTTNERAIFGRVGLPDRLPLANVSQTTHRMTGAPSITFAEVGATGDTITRSAGSFVSDGFAAGDIITISGSASNDMTIAAKVASVTATVITLGSDDLVDEGPASGVTITGEASLVFSGSSDAVTRSAGSWLDDGFRVGDSVTVAGSSSNDGTFTVAAVSALVLTFESGDLADETIGIGDVTLGAGQTKAAWMAALGSSFAALSDSARIALHAGRTRRISPFSSWFFRRPVSWDISIREYQHDVHRSPYRKDDGPLGSSILDADGNLAEWDDLLDGAAGTAARISTVRSWGNGPGGAFVARSLTRAPDGSILGDTNNAAVVNLADNTVQAATEAAIGRDVELKDLDGTMVPAERSTLEMQVNKVLARVLLENSQGEGARVSSVVWTAAADDDLSGAEPVINGTLALGLKGTIHTINTRVRVLSGGA